MSVAKVTASEVFESLTGYDEIAIAKFFGVNPQEFDDEGNSMLVGTLFGRSLVFVLLRREGNADAEAYDAAMNLRTPDLLAYFTPEGDEESGKDSEVSEPQPEDSPTSA